MAGRGSRATACPRQRDHGRRRGVVPHLRPRSTRSRRRWPSLPSRVVLTTTSAARGSRSRRRPRHVLRASAGSPNVTPSSSRRSLAAGHEVGSHGHLHTRVYELDPDAFRADLRAERRGAAAAGADARRHVPRAGMVDQRPLAVGARRAGAETASWSTPAWRRCKLVGDVRYPRGAASRRTAAGPILEVPPLVADRFGQVMPLGWGWGLRMSSPRRVLRAVEAANQAGAPAVLTVHPWEIDPDPPRVAPSAAALVRALLPARRLPDRLSARSCAAASSAPSATSTGSGNCGRHDAVAVLHSSEVPSGVAIRTGVIVDPGVHAAFRTSDTRRPAPDGRHRLFRRGVSLARRGCGGPAGRRTAPACGDRRAGVGR